MIKPGLITLEFLNIVVRVHDKPTKWGEFAPYNNGFILHQVEPNVYEAKLAKDLKFSPSHQRELRERMMELEAKKVFLWRHREGRDPYKMVITPTGIARES